MHSAAPPSAQRTENSQNAVLQVLLQHEYQQKHSNRVGKKILWENVSPHTYFVFLDGEVIDSHEKNLDKYQSADFTKYLANNKHTPELRLS